jgi:hypothetical protein
VHICTCAILAVQQQSKGRHHFSTLTPLQSSMWFESFLQKTLAHLLPKQRCTAYAAAGCCHRPHRPLPPSLPAAAGHRTRQTPRQTSPASAPALAGHLGRGAVLHNGAVCCSPQSGNLEGEHHLYLLRRSFSSRVHDPPPRARWRAVGGD